MDSGVAYETSNVLVNLYLSRSLDSSLAVDVMILRKTTPTYNGLYQHTDFWVYFWCKDRDFETELIDVIAITMIASYIMISSSMHQLWHP